MMYKIFKRIQNWKSTVGYQLLTEDKKILNMSKNQVLQAAHQGLIINAVYNKHTKSISGTDGTDLRSLPVIQHSDIINSRNEGNNPRKNKAQNKSNHQLAKEYIEKTRNSKCDTGNMKLELLTNDRVKLISVVDKQSTGTFILPSFVTEHETSLDYRNIISTPFRGCKFTEIIVEGDYTDWNLLFSNMSSDRLSIKYSGKPVTNMNKAFYNCSELLNLDISTVNISEGANMAGMFSGCVKLKQFKLGKTYK